MCLSSKSHINYGSNIKQSTQMQELPAIDILPNFLSVGVEYLVTW